MDTAHSTAAVESTGCGQVSDRRMGEKIEIFVISWSSRIFFWKRIDLEGNTIKPSLSARIGC
jgi:hypothetical protein